MSMRMGEGRLLNKGGEEKAESSSSTFWERAKLVEVESKGRNGGPE